MPPVGRRERLRAHLFQQACEVAQAPHRFAARAVEQAHGLAHAAQQDRPSHRLQSNPCRLPVGRQTLVGRSEAALHAGRLAEQSPHLRDIRAGLPSRPRAFPLRRPLLPGGLLPHFVRPVLRAHPQAGDAVLVGSCLQLGVPAFSWTLETCVTTGVLHSRGGVSGRPQR